MVKYLLIKKSSALSLIELLLAILIVAALTATMLKQFSTKKKYPLRAVLKTCQNMIQEGMINAINQKKIIAMHFFFNELGQLTHIGQIPHEKNNTKAITYKKELKNPIFVNTFFINGKNEMETRSKQIWLLIFPDGHLQETSLSFQEEHKDPSFYDINPFTGIIDYAT